MAGSLKTAFYNLVKYAANDITSWLSDFNGNMDKIDTALNQNKTAAQTAQDGVDTLEAEYNTVTQTLATHTSQIDANEKAIAANSTSIEELGNEVNEIEIGEYSRHNLGSVTKIESLLNGLTFYAMRVGKGAIVNCQIDISPGTLHRYDRVINGGIYSGNYLTDFFRINGNPFNLPKNVFIPFSTIGYKVGNTSDSSACYAMGMIYAGDSNFTAVGIISGDTEQLVIDVTTRNMS